MLLPKEKWLSIKEAAPLLGISYKTLRLIVQNRPGLVRLERPSKARILLAEESVIALKAAIWADPEFWRKHPPQPPPEAAR